MKRRFVLIPIILLATCAQTPGIDLTPMPLATAADPDWIREFDAAMMKKQAEIQAEARRSPKFQYLLWKRLQCSREIDIAQARAADLIARRDGISRADAMVGIRVDPVWILADQQCRR